MAADKTKHDLRIEDLLKSRIVLDYPMDILLDRRCQLSRYEDGVIARLRGKRPKQELRTLAYKPDKTLNDQETQDKKLNDQKIGDEKIGGLSYPDEDKGVPGSGNILLVGRPGTGKSTLALQWAVVCTERPNTYSSLFLSLEETATQVRQKATDLGWHRQLHELRFCRAGEAPPLEFTPSNSNSNRAHRTSESPDEQAENLKLAIDRPVDCTIELWNDLNDRGSSREICEQTKHDAQPKGKVGLFLATLTPKARDCNDPQRTFNERYRQIEDLLLGFRRLRKDGVTDLRMVCIDGLSSLGDGPLSREQIRQLFGLFQRCGVVGVCTAEEPTTTEVLEMEYLADIVIHLRNEEDGSYLVRHLEITKSRYQQQVNGRHSFRIRRPMTQRQLEECARFQAVIVTPSIHYISHATRLAPDDGDRIGDDANFDIGSPGATGILPHKLRRPAIVTIRGKSGTYKSSIAHNFLMRGLAHPKRSESALLLTLAEQTHFGGRDSDWLLDDSTDTTNLNWESVERESIDDGKLRRRVWRCRDTQALLIEIAFKQGALLAEEFIEYVRDAFRLPKSITDGRRTSPKIRRVVLDDVSMIGPSYPLLRHSQTGGELCLSTLVHLMRAKEVDLVMVGSPGNFAEADEMVHRACTLSDTVLSCEFCDIFGQRHVLVTGEGLMSGRTAEGTGRDRKGTRREREGTVVPGVIVVDPAPKGGRTSFRVDREVLKGLVGYEKGNIHRPGVVLHVFSEGDILKSYNRELEAMLEQACASPGLPGIPAVGDHDRGLASKTVTVQPYGSDRSEAIHDSLTILGRKPVDKTVLVAVDEFVGAEDSDASEDKDDVKKNASARPAEGPFAQLTSHTTEAPLGQSRKRSKYYVWNSLTQDQLLVPYYANVLVLAYNTSLVPKGWNPEKWSEILKKVKTPTWTAPLPPKGHPSKTDDDLWDEFLDDWFTKPLLRRTSTGGEAPAVYWPFEAGAWSMETLACILLDAIASIALKTEEESPPKVLAPEEVYRVDTERGAKLLKFIKSPDLHGVDVEAELTSLAYLFYYSWRHWALELSRAQALKIEKRMSNKLVPNAAVYVCWYTQLRELIDEYPQLGSMLRVCPLPGGGFKGDWFIGVLQGSVSHSLGVDVLNRLCHENEERKRFVRGVGLPVRSSYVKKRKDFLAWPRAKDMYLDDIIEIHRCALSRSRILNYTKLRGILGTFGRQIAFSAADESMSTADAVRDCIKRLPRVVKRFGKGSHPIGR